MARATGLAALGDILGALAGRTFGDSGVASTALAVSPALTPIDCSLGDTFSYKLRASSVFKIGNPTNPGAGAELNFHFTGVTTFGTLVWDTAYALTGALATFSTAKIKSIGFKFNTLTGKFTETYRTTSKSG
jgi:hypothetical protein